MHRVVDTAAGGNLATLASKLNSLSPEQERLLGEASSDICWLKGALPFIHVAFLALSDEEQPDIIEIQPLKNKVRDLAYDIEDALDEFKVILEGNTTSLLRRREITNQGDFPASIINTIKTSTERIRGSLLQDNGAAREVLHLHVIRGSSLGAASHGTGTAILDNAPHVVPDGLLQFESQAQGIIRFLDANNDLVVRIVGVGVGGLGMMNLAKLVYGDIKWRFNCKAYVSVPRNPDRSKVLRDILHAFGCGGDDQQEELVGLVRKHVQDKRYLVVVDGVCNAELWRSLLQEALPNNLRGSRVIFANHCSDNGHTNHPATYTVRHFDSSDTKQLFLQRALGQQECPPQIEEDFDIIMRVCDGSPLATLAMSGLLATMALDQWQEISNCLRRAIQEDSSVDVLRKIIFICYSRLPHHLKTCLLYLSIFPENCEISRNDLVSRWIAEGFICREGNESLTEAGDRYFHDLICRGLIQPVETEYDGQATTCRVDSTLMDFIRSKAVEENFVTLQLGSNHQESEIKIRRLSIQNTQDAARLKDEDVQVQQVRSLTAFGLIEQMPRDLWFKFLRVLDLGGCSKSNNTNDDRNYPIDFEGLFQLKYLNPGPIAINMLSEEMRHLQQLETLDLRRSIDQWECEGEEVLPQTINQLGRLVRLLIDPSTKLPDQIGGMTALEELGEIDIEKHSPQFLQQLRRLTKLKQLVVHLCHMSEMQGQDTEEEQALVESLCQLAQCNLHSLSMYIFDHDADHGLISFGPSWEPAFSTLQSLSIMWGFIVQVPDWMNTFTRLKKLRLGIYEMQQNELDILGGLDSLVDLFLHFNRFPETHDLVFHGSWGFRNLKRFGVRTGRIRINAITRGNLVFEDGSMPFLQNYSVELDAWEFGVSDFVGHYFGINYLTSIKTAQIIIRYVSGGEDEVHRVKTAIKTAISNLPSHPIANIDILSFGPRA